MRSQANRPQTELRLVLLSRRFKPDWDIIICQLAKEKNVKVVFTPSNQTTRYTNTIACFVDACASRRRAGEFLQNQLGHKSRMYIAQKNPHSISTNVTIPG